MLTTAPAPEPLIAGGVTTPVAPTVEILAIGAGVLAALLYRRRPPVTWGTVYALVPWLLVGSALHVLGGLNAYPTSIGLAFDRTGSYLTAFLFAGLAWVLAMELSPAGRTSGVLPRYVGAMGIGTAVVLVPVVLWQGGVPSFRALVWLATVPIAAAAAAAVTVFLFGFWHPDAAAHAGFVGGLVVFGHALDGLATVIGVSAVDSMGHTTLTGPLAAAVAGLPTAESVGLAPALVWPSLFVWLRIALAALAVALYAPYVREHPTRGNVILGLVAAVGLGPGVTRLLQIGVMG